jgi:choline dehydrogenase-like flavoprotein
MHHGLTNDPKAQPVTYRRNENEPTKLWKAIEYGRQVGGGTVHFTANYRRLQESDFHERSLYGEIPGTGFADWPVSYADLEPITRKPNTIWASQVSPEPTRSIPRARSHSHGRGLRSPNAANTRRSLLVSGVTAVYTRYLPSETNLRHQLSVERETQLSVRVVSSGFY